MRTLPQSFVGGVLSPRMFGRPDDPKYQHGAAVLDGFYVETTGAARNRPKSEFVRSTRNPNKRARLIRYRAAGAQDLQVELGFRQEYPGSSSVPGYLRLHRKAQTVLHSKPWNAATAYVVGDFVTQAGVLYRCTVAHTNNVPPNVGLWRSHEYVSNKTFAPGDVNVGTNEITISAPHLFVDGEPLDFTNDSGGAGIEYAVLPAPIVNPILSFGYAIVISPTVIKVSLTPGGPALDLLTQGTGGPHRVHRRYTAGELVSQSGSVFYCRTSRPIDGLGLSIPANAGNETHWYLEPASGEYELPTTLAITEDQLFEFTYSQQADRLSIAGLGNFLCELAAVAPNQFTDPAIPYAHWRWVQISFAAQLPAPVASIAATKRGTTLKITTLINQNPGKIGVASPHRLTAGLDHVLIENCSVRPALNNLWLAVDTDTGDATQFKPIDPDTGAYLDFTTGGAGASSGTVRVGRLNADISNSYVVTAADDDGRESQQSNTVTVQNHLNVTGAYNTISWNAVPGATRYFVYKLVAGTDVFGLIGESRTTSLKDGPPAIAASLARTPPRFDTTLASAASHTALPNATDLMKTPAAVGHFEGSRVLAGTSSGPQDIWKTRTNTESDLTYGIPVKATDRIHQQVKARIACSIRHLLPLGQLVALADTCEFRISPINTDALTPESFVARPQSYVGSARVQPAVMHNVALFVARVGGHVWQIGFRDDVGGYDTVDLCVRAAHLFDGLTIVQMAEQLSPIPILWCLSSDGRLFGLTFVPRQQVFAWHVHPSAGFVESVSVGGEDADERAYAEVRRTINGSTVRYIERAATMTKTSLEDSWFVDCGVRVVTTDPVSAVTGLGHLEGQQVAVFANGVVQARQVVAGGQITLETALPAGNNKVLVGLPCEDVLQTVPAAFAIEGYASGRPKSVSKVHVRVENSGPFEIGVSLDDMTRIELKDGETLINRLVEVRVPNGWGDDGQLFIRQRDPLPLNIVSVTAEMALGAD